MQILVRDRPITVSTDRVKPAYMLKETGRGTTTMTFNPAADATPAMAPHVVQTGSGVQTTSSPMGTGGSFSGGKAVWA
jgi:hypothetical protein